MRIIIYKGINQIEGRTLQTLHKRGIYQIKKTHTLSKDNLR